MWLILLTIILGWLLAGFFVGYIVGTISKRK